MVLQKLFGEDVDDEDLPELTWKGDLIDFRGSKAASFWPAKLARAQADTTYTFEIPRIRYGDESHDWHADETPCHDCSAIKGEYHADDSCEIHWFTPPPLRLLLPRPARATQFPQGARG